MTMPRPDTERHRRAALACALMFLVTVSCGAQAAAPDAAATDRTEPGTPDASSPSISLAESWPIESTLDHATLPDAPEVWPAMIDGAAETIEMAEFYGATEPDSRLEPVLAALERAGKRGVRVRILFDKKFYGFNAAVPDRLGTLPGIEVRILDLDAVSGGVLHAKYFVIDGKELWLGSQNLDWRSLTHIQELGARVTVPAMAQQVRHIFELDWAMAGGAAVDDARAPLPALADPGPWHAKFGDDDVVLHFAASPEKLLPTGVAWDLPPLLQRIDQATTRVRLQVMSYGLEGHDKKRYTELDDALRAAAARGVVVELMVADWNIKPGRIEELKALQEVPNVTVKLVTIPQWSGGFVPYARVIHSKFATVDGTTAWLGTSNASGDYFHNSRNVSLFVDGAAFCSALDAFFETTWTSQYAAEVDPARAYEPPRVGK